MTRPTDESKHSCVHFELETQLAEANKEVERLTNICQTFSERELAFGSDIDKLQASSARMRSALEEIALENIVKDDCAATGSAVYMQRIATEALLSTKDGEAIQPTGDGA